MSPSKVKCVYFSNNVCINIAKSKTCMEVIVPQGKHTHYHRKISFLGCVKGRIFHPTSVY
jgi:hypothetical protein